MSEPETLTPDDDEEPEVVAHGGEDLPVFCGVDESGCTGLQVE